MRGETGKEEMVNVKAESTTNSTTSGSTSDVETTGFPLETGFCLGVFLGCIILASLTCNNQGSFAEKWQNVKEWLGMERGHKVPKDKKSVDENEERRFLNEYHRTQKEGAELRSIIYWRAVDEGKIAVQARMNSETIE